MRTNWVFNLALVLGGGVVALLIVEAGLRLAGVSYPYFYIPDPVMGYAHKPGAEGWWKKEGVAYIRINSAGFRDREHTRDKPSGTFRIAILGDSYSEALQVSIEQTFWALLESNLQQCRAFNGRGVEVLNFGVSGYSTAQELLLLRQRVWDYAPDLILLAFLTFNDIQENSNLLAGDQRRPYFVLENERLVLDTRFREQLAYRIRSLPLSSEMFDYSRLLQVLREAEYRFRKTLRDETIGSLMMVESGRKPKPEWIVYLEPRDLLWKEAWRVTEALLAEIHQEVKSKRVGFLLVTLSNPEQIHPDLHRRQEIATTLGLPDLLYPDHRVASWAERHGVDLLSLAQPLGSYAQTHQVFLHGFSNATIGDGHWNVEGHRLAGSLIAEKVCSMQRMSSGS